MKSLVLVFISLLLSGLASAGEIQSVLAHPIFKGFYSCTEHWAGQFSEPGDALGADCIIQDLIKSNGRTWLKAYKGTGNQNADWYGWEREVLSPCDCVVATININPITNIPGVMGKGMASFVVLKRSDGVMFLLAHIQNLKVQVGGDVKAGQPIAQVGNNGQARSPHVHIGAWQEKVPLQIRFDQNHMGEAESQ